MVFAVGSKRNVAGWEQRRRAAVLDWRQGRGVREVARRYGVSHVSVLRWIRCYERRGLRGLRARRATGRPPKLPRDRLTRLGRYLLQGAAHFGYFSDLWTTPRIADLIYRLWGVRYHRAHVWRLLQRLGFSWQRPERRARERDERKVRRWLGTVWPAIKKNASKPAAPCSFWTNRASP